MIEKGDIVKPIKNERIQYMNSEFQNWVEENMDKTFYVQIALKSAIELAKVRFWISKDFLTVEKR